MRNSPSTFLPFGQSLDYTTAEISIVGHGLVWNPQAAIPAAPLWSRQIYVDYVGANPYARLGDTLRFTLVIYRRAWK